MKKISELTEFYYRGLHPILVQLDKKRETIRFRLILVACALLLCDVIYLRYARVNLIMILLVNVLIAFGMYRYLLHGYKEEFKDNVILPLIHQIDDNLVYMKNSHIDQRTFEQSKIFTGVPDGLRGNDYIYGKKDLFEPSVFHSLLEYKTALEYIVTLHLAISIVEELKLNEKLWSKA